MLLHSATAQTPEPLPAPPTGPTLVLQNLAPFARREGVAVVVPFAPGAAKEAPSLGVPGVATTWQPFGACWPDGSWRQALCLFVAELPALGETRLTLTTTPAPLPPDAAITPPAAKIEFLATVGGTTVRAEPARAATLEANARRVVELRRARLGDSGLLAEVLLTSWRDQPHAQVDVAVFCSDPRQTAMQCDVEELAIECTGMALVLRHPGRLAIEQATTATGSRTVLLRQRAIGDGQGLRRTGVLVPARRGDRSLADETTKAACVAPLLGATDWTASGAFGPFGHVPPVPPWLQGESLRRYFARSHRDFVAADRGPGDAFGVFRHGMERMAGQTGDQNDFGVAKLTLVAASGLPSQLLEVELSALQEACRPVHFFEADGAPVEPAAHPDWIVWSGRTHWHGGVSKDRLGKPVPEPPYETHGWTGKDREHWSNNYLAAFALLTGAHWARQELQNEVRLYLAGQTLDSKYSTSNAGVPRGAGRTALAAAWTLLVTGDAALRERMDARMDQVYLRQWAGRELPPDQVRPMAVAPPDARMLQGKYPYWNPWQDALAAVGFAAQHRVTGNTNARTLAEALARNVVAHGWLVTDERNEVAMAQRWLDGKPLTREQWLADDPTMIQRSTNTAFSDWAFPAVEIARVAADRDGDTALRDKCAEIQRRMRGGRQAPRDGGMDRFGEWDAVVWQ